jgi:hypothetical protein
MTDVSYVKDRQKKEVQRTNRFSRVAILIPTFDALKAKKRITPK